MIKSPIYTPDSSGCVPMFKRFFILLLLLLLLLPVSPARANISNLPTLSVLVDSSLSLPVVAIGRNYAREKGVAVNITSDDSSELVERISEGTEADVFISANPRWIEDLKLQGLIDVYSSVRLASNQLSLIAPGDEAAPIPDAPGELKRYLMQAAREGKLMISNPDTREDGNYVRILLERLGIWEEISPYLMYTENPFEIPAAVTSQQIHAMTYRTAALSSDDVRVLYDFPPEIAPEIMYQAVVVAGERMEAAREFLFYLENTANRNLLGSFGYAQPSLPAETEE